LMFAGLGTVIASLLEDMQGFQLIMNFLVMPIFFLSGALFPLNNLPPVINVIARINPLSYGVDALRGSLIVNGAHFGLLTDSIVLLGMVVVLLALGSYFFSRMEA